MTEILSTAAYVHHPQALAEQKREQTLRGILAESQGRHPEIVWRLLETPQTIDTLCRALANDGAIS